MSTASVRNEMIARRQRAVRVEELRAGIVSRIREGSTAGWTKTTYRCELRHRRSGSPKLAEVFKTDLGLLWVSKIAWLPSDQLTLRPWEREQLMGPAISDGTFHLCMENEEYLRDHLASLEEWAAGRPARGPRWLAGAGPTVIVELVEAEQPLVGGRALWVRCKDHPDDAEALDPRKVIADTR